MGAQEMRFRPFDQSQIEQRSRPPAIKWHGMVIRTVLASGTRMPKIQNYRDLIAWQRSMDLAVLVYRVTQEFPPRERYGLALQMRGAAVSIPSNIAEGHRQRTRAYVKHLVIAMGSHGELDTQSELSFRLNFIVGQERTALAALTDEVGRLTNGLLQSMAPYL
jgi:four helix bundle protein